MTKRGRPAHPDILTPREWEVLEHLREGLSNDEIAGRLGISVNGVKFHVTEILSKLNLENRYDAARWAESDAREARPWWTAAAAPLLIWRKAGFGWLSPVLAGGLAVGVAAGIGVLVWALLVTRGDGEVDLDDLTVDEFISHVQEALTKDGHVFHTSVEWFSIPPDGDRQRMMGGEIWVDTQHEVTRGEYEGDPSWLATSDSSTPSEAVLIEAGDSIYESGDGADATQETYDACKHLFSFLGDYLNFECESPSETADFTPRRLETDVEYNSIAAVALVVDGTQRIPLRDSPIAYEFTMAFYFDRESLLPLALVYETRPTAGESTGGLVYSFENESANEFVPVDSLPAGFFDPASIGYVEPTPTNR